MAKLSQISKVVIELSTASIAKASFGIPMFVGASTAAVWKNATTGATSYTMIYTDVAAAVIDKLEQPFIDAIQEAFSQTPRIERVMVGRLVPNEATFQPDNSLADTNTGKFPTGTVFELTVNGTSVKYTSVADDTRTQVAAGLLAAAKGLPALTTDYNFAADSVNSYVIRVTPKVVSNGAPMLGNVSGVTVQNGSIKPTDITSGLTQINSESNIWYGFALLDRTSDLVLEAAKWAEAAEPSKQFFTASDDPKIWSAATDDILSKLRDLQYQRTTLIAHKAAKTEWPEAAWMAKVYTADPGSVIFGLKVLSSITPSVFTPGEQQFIWGKNGNTYERYADNTFLINQGTTVSGEWVDIIRDRDWLIDYIQKSVASAMIRRKKIPYTNTGIQIIVNVLQGCLRYAQQMGVLAPDERNGDGETVPGFVISYPNAADVSADVKAKRTLYISFVGLLAGAIQLTDIKGVLAYKYGE
ncbi:tail sheath protein [Pantoea phage Nafs113]|nr:tail sheath protein [Pantoea phage Nafs113]